MFRTMSTSSNPQYWAHVLRDGLAFKLDVDERDTWLKWRDEGDDVFINEKISSWMKRRLEADMAA